MKTIKFCSPVFFVIALLSLFFTACNDSDDGSQTSRVMVRMTDAPGDYEEVNIDVQDILIKASTDADDSQGWVSIGTVTPKVYNLLDLTGGVSVLLADKVVPAGYLGQIRLLLGDENSVKLAGAATTIPLNTPSAQQSGLKLQVNKILEAGKTYEFLLDFDVEHSVVKAGNSGIYNLHPVIRVSTKENTGSIIGKIVTGTPPSTPEFAVAVSIPVEGGTIETAMNVPTGEFELNGVPAGTYTVTLTPEPVSGKTVKTIANVVVVNGQITDVGSVSF